MISIIQEGFFTGFFPGLSYFLKNGGLNWKNHLNNVLLKPDAIKNTYENLLAGSNRTQAIRFQARNRLKFFAPDLEKESGPFKTIDFDPKTSTYKDFENELKKNLNLSDEQLKMVGRLTDEAKWANRIAGGVGYTEHKTIPSAIMSGALYTHSKLNDQKEDILKVLSNSSNFLGGEYHPYLSVGAALGVPAIAGATILARNKMKNKNGGRNSTAEN